MQPTGKSRFLLACLALFAGCIASLGWQADWRSGSAWYALLYSELFVLALILAWLQKALHLLSGMPRAEVFHEVLGRILTWRVHQAMGIASLGLRDPGLVLVSWLVLSALTEAAGSAIDSFVKETDRKHAGEELIRKQRSELLRLVQTVAADTLAIPIGDLPLAAPLGADSATAVRFSVALEKELEADLAGKRLPATLLFDLPTLTEIAEGLPDLLSGKPAKPVHPVHAQQVGSADLLISAFSCELPGASDLQELWPRLQTEVDDVQEVPIRRWDWADAEIPGARHGSFLEGADLFDASFFGLQSAEAQAMDPQQRLLLRTSYGALAQSGHDKGTLLGAPHGVFAAVSNQDWYSWSFSQERGPTSAFTGTGVAAALAANRISFSLGLRGPSMTIDTACSSSLTALSAASAQLQRPAASGRASRRRIRESVAAGCELLLGPKPMQLRHAAGMLSSTGRCKTFNSTADGYVRGEGCGAAVLTIDEHASWTGTVLLCAAAINQDGRSATLTAPNRHSQQDVILDAMSMACVPAVAVGMVECHGTGTALGDPIEAGALAVVLGTSKAEDPLWLAAGKTNVGHLEAAAGFAGAGKVIACLINGKVPANLHFAELNPHIELVGLAIPTQATQLAESPNEKFISGLSSFGFGGSNAHVLLAQPKDACRKKGGASSGRGHRVAMLFTGQSRLRPGLGRELYAANAAFRAALDRCATLCSDLNEGLLDILFGDTTSAETCRTSFTATFCIQYALVEAWRSWGVRPHAVLGHSLGEYAAAVAAGVLSLEDGIRVVMARGRRLDEMCTPGEGSMAAVFAPSHEVRIAMEKIQSARSQGLTIAAINGPSQTVVSGRASLVEDLCSLFPSRSRKLTSLHAMHSELLAAVLPGLEKELQTCAFSCPAEGVVFVSCLSGARETLEVAKPAYWLSHDTARPVKFDLAMRSLAEFSCTVYLEIGPRPLLLPLGQSCIGQSEAAWLPSLEPDRCETESMLSALRSLKGTSFKPPDLQLQRVPWVRPCLHPLLGSAQIENGSEVFRSRIALWDDESATAAPVIRLFRQHRVYGQAVLPAASHLLLLSSATLATHYPGNVGSYAQEMFVELTDTVFESAFVLSASSQAHAEVQILPTGAKLSSRSGDGHASHAQSQSTRVVGGPGARGSILQHSLVEWKSRCQSRRSALDAYRTLEKLGLEYGPSFRAISSWSSSGDGSHVLGRLSLNLETWDSSLDFHPGILDGAIQLLLLACSSSDSQQCFLPFSIDNCVIATALRSRDVWVTVLVRTVSAEAVSGDVEISTDDGVLIARLSRLSCRARDRRPKLPESKQQPQLEQMYSVAFVEMESPGTETETATDAVVWCSEERQGELLAALSWKAEICSFARDETTALNLLGSGKFGYVAFLAEGDQLEALYNALQVLQISSKLNTSVVLAAQAAQPPELDQNAFDPTHAGLWGLARSARLEMPEQSVMCLDLPADGTFMSVSSCKQEQEVCLREKAAYAARLQKSSFSPRWPLQLSLRNRGSFSSLVPEPQQSKSGFRVAAVGLNFRDVLNVLDLYPGDPGEPGLDCSGIVLDGPHAAHAALPGTRLFGISFGCLRTFATIKEPRLLVERPASWSHAEAAALPTVFTTVDMALCELAGLKAGQRVLIHAGAGGVGLTAVQYALRLGALVYATAGKEDKQSLLRRMGVTCVASSRDGSKFEEEMANALAKENSAKIDVVLNSLSHDNFIGRSLAFVGAGGIFIEIGKRGIWTKDEMERARPDVEYRTLAMDTVCEEDPAKFQELMKRLSARMMDGSWDPIPSRVFDGLESCSEALQVLRKANNIGKIVVTVPSLLQVREGAKYLITGGTGALGLALSRALLEEGVEDLVLLSRSGTAPSMPWLARSAVQVSFWACDLSAADAHQILIQKDGWSSLAAVFHLSGIIQDGSLARLSRQDLQATFGPKVRGLHVLEQVLMETNRWQHLDFVLAFSSTSAILGSAGQANYAAANACMDAMMHKWRLAGQRALSLQWGAWLNLGMAQPHSLRHLCQQGIPVDVGLAAMASAMAFLSVESAVSFANVDWEAFLRPVQARQYFTCVEPCRDVRVIDVAKKDANQKIRGIGIPSPYQNALDWVLAVLAGLIGIEIGPEDPLTAAGLDSLSAVEFRRKLSTDSGIKVPQTLAFDYPTAQQVSVFLESQSQGSFSAAPQTSSVDIQKKVSVCAVQGNSCRFPGVDVSTASAAEASQAWQIFCKEVDAVTEVPLRRFDINECFDANMSGADFVTYARHASMLEGTDLFDHRIFGISSNEASAIDPQQRNTLEVSYAACHDAGRLRKSLAKAAIGVFVGQCANDWAKTSRERRAGTFMGPGTHASIAANRLSFCLGLEGVSVAVDTACSSTLVALDLAILRLRAGLEAVICSGSQLNLIVEPFVAFSNGRLLSASGRCRTFDASADGFARGEGFGSLFISEDLGHGQGSAGTVLASMANQDGRSSSLTAPNGPAQQRVINATLGLSGLKAAEVSAVECHGTGTALGDPIEVGGLRGTLGDGRLNTLFLMAGKSNVGHLEGAAGALGLQKCLAIVAQLEVPPNLHLSSLNPHVELEDFNAKASTTLEKLSGMVSANVGLSSFGFGGTNAHALLQSSRPHVREPPETLPALSFRRIAFPWAAPVPRLLSLKRREGSTVIFEVQVDAELVGLCSHMVYDQTCMSSALLIAFAMDACRQHAKQAVQLKNVQMVAPLFLPCDYDGQTWLRLALLEQQFQVLSKPRLSSDAWMVHCSGRYATQAASRPLAASLGGTLSILGSAAARQRQPAARGSESFEALCRNAEPVADAALEELKAKLAEGTPSPLGASMELLSDVHIKKGELCARLRLPLDFAKFSVHPAFLQAIHGAVLGLGFFNEEMSESLWQDLASVVSCSVSNVDIPQGTEHFILHVRRRGSVISSRSLPAAATVSLDGGPTLLDMQDIHLRPLSKKQVVAAASMRQTRLDIPSIFEMNWVSGSSQGRTFADEGGIWLMLCPADPELARGLQEAFQSLEVHAGDGQVSESESSVEEAMSCPAEDTPADAASKSASESASASTPSERRRHRPFAAGIECSSELPIEEDLSRFAKIVVVASGDGSARAVEVLQAAVEALKAVSQLVQDAQSPEIWFVMAGTQAAQAEDLAKRGVPFHAGLWGLARCARREQRVMAGCIDVDSTCPRAILSRLRAARSHQEDDDDCGPETELLVRSLTLDAEESDSDELDLERYVARLEQTSAEAWGVWPPPTLPSLGWFLISGGCSGLGLVSAAWLVTQGVTHLALLSRTGQCKENTQRQALEELCEAPDLQVCLRPCDVSIRKEVDEMLASLKDCDAVSVKGVLHAAGVLQDHAIAHLESEHLATVISPKMDGAINLHESLSSADIEHFLLFSSVAALLGSPGQGNYAAANSFLDSFALFRQARGLPALSVQWGPWADVGMAARSGVGGPGFWAPKISPRNALQALSAVIAAGRGPASSAALSITRVNWSALLKRMSSVPPAWTDWKSRWERPVRTAASPVRPLRTGTDAGIRSLQGQRRPLGMSTGEGIPFGLGLSFGITGSGLRLPERASRPPQTQGSKSDQTDSGSASSDSESPDGVGGGALGL